MAKLKLIKEKDRLNDNTKYFLEVDDLYVNGSMTFNYDEAIQYFNNFVETGEIIIKETIKECEI